ncbi:hypothetical protein DFH09DRAFT_1291598 [Mycena vulgaris]|nr:hypothetical protein DFH09DRAFT_1291598 [Mycena vulgaris]
MTQTKFNAIGANFGRISSVILAWIGMTPKNTSCVDGVVRKPQLNWQFNVYEFQWLECTDGAVYLSAHSSLPVLMLRTLVRDRKFLKEIEGVKLTENLYKNPHSSRGNNINSKPGHIKTLPRGVRTMRRRCRGRCRDPATVPPAHITIKKTVDGGDGGNKDDVQTIPRLLLSKCDMIVVTRGNKRHAPRKEICVCQMPDAKFFADGAARNQPEVGDERRDYLSRYKLPRFSLNAPWRSTGKLLVRSDGSICHSTKPDDPNHQNPTLSSIFDAAIPRVAQVLVSWNDNHLAIRSFNEYFSGKKSHLRNRQAADWIRTLGLVPTPELETILSAPLLSLMVYPGLSDISEHECHTRVMGVGSVLLQLLAVQHKLKEPLDLNGDLIEDLLDNSVVPCRSDGDDAFNVMFAALESPPAKSGVLVQQMLKFKRDHTVFDEEFQPPTFRRDRPSHIQPNIAIPVVAGGVEAQGMRWP